MDNADNEALLLDYLHARSHGMKVAITTRDATLFADIFPQLVLDVFDQAEAQEFIRARFAANLR